MTDIRYSPPSVHRVEKLEIRFEANVGAENPAYVIIVDGERLATVFGKDGKFPRLVTPMASQIP